MQLFRIAVIAAALACTSASADSLFTKRVALEGTLISDQKVRFERGDIITVLIRENVDATTTSTTETDKQVQLDANAAAADNRFLVGGGTGGLGILPKELLPNWQIDANNSHGSEGTTSRSNELTMDVSCVVTKVLDNGNVFIEGSKTVKVNRESTKLFISGIVRARDVTPANTVFSTQIADASVDLKGQGPLWNNDRRGFITKFLDWISPF